METHYTQYNKTISWETHLPQLFNQQISFLGGSSCVISGVVYSEGGGALAYTWDKWDHKAIKASATPGPANC